MSIVVLVELSPRRASDGAVQTIRLVWNAAERANFFGVQWLPKLLAVPGLDEDIGFDGYNFAQGATPALGDIVVALSADVAAWSALIWKGAAVAIKTAPKPAAGDPADGAFTDEPAAIADAASVAGGVLTIKLLDPGAPLRRPLALTRFGSSGDALLDGAGAADHKGEAVPIGWGALSTIPGRLVDRANNLWVFLGRPATAIGGFYDGGAAFTLGTARANRAALIANVPAAGAVDYCLNDAGLVLARPWTAPVYPFTADLTAGVTTAADIAAAIVALRTSLAFTAGTVAAHNGLQGAPCQLYVDDATTTVAEALDQLLAPLGSMWRLSSAGTITLQRIGFAGAPDATFGSWQVASSVDRLSIVMPTATRELGFARCNRVHSEGEIASILRASDLAYADGTPIESLKPAQAGADVTGSNTAANSAALGGTPAASVAAAVASAATTSTWAGVSGTGKPADNADVTAAQAIVSRLSSSSGQALASFVLANGLGPVTIVAAGSNRDGDAITFAGTLAAVPKIFFLPGGNSGVAGQNLVIAAQGLTASGFTLKAKTQSVTPGSLVTDGSASAGTGGEPDYVINRTSGSAPYDGAFKFRFSVTVGAIAPGEPGQVEIAIYVKQSGAWVNVGGQSYSVSGTYDLTVYPGSVDFGAGNEFGIDLVYAEGSGSALTGFTSVKYTPGTVSETSLTPSGASDIPWIALL